MDDVDLHLLGGELYQRVAQRLYRTVHVALDDDVQLVEVAQSKTAAHLVERQHLLRAQALFALQLLALVGYLACLLLGLDDVERVAGSRGAVQTQYQGGFGGACLLHALVALVEHCLHLSVAGSGKHDVAHLERTVRYQHRSHVAAALVQRGFDDGTRGTAVGVRFQLQHFGFEQHLLHQFGNADALLG